MPVATFYKIPTSESWTEVNLVAGLSPSELSEITTSNLNMASNWGTATVAPNSQNIMHQIYKDAPEGIVPGINVFQTRCIAYASLGPFIDPIDTIDAVHYVRVHNWGNGFLQINPSI